MGLSCNFNYSYAARSSTITHGRTCICHHSSTYPFPASFCTFLFCILNYFSYLKDLDRLSRLRRFRLPPKPLKNLLHPWNGGLQSHQIRFFMQEYTKICCYFNSESFFLSFLKISGVNFLGNYINKFCILR